MPPPKRKTTGRVTPKGTRPGQATPAHALGHHDHTHVESSSRYTPPIPQSVKESPKWVPILMLVLIGGAVLVILLRYLVWTDTNVPVIVGLLLLLSGLFVATKWH